MSALAKTVFLTFALFASFACALWIALTVYVMFSFHGTQPRIILMFPVLILAGAAGIGFKFYFDERRGSPTFSTEAYLAQQDDERLLTTPLRSGIAVAFTALTLFQAIREALNPSLKVGALSPFGFLLHGAPLATANVAFWAYVVWVAFWFIRGTRGRERVMVVGWAVSFVFGPVEKLWPKWALAMRYTVVLALLLVLLAAFSLLLRPLSPAGSSDDK